MKLDVLGIFTLSICYGTKFMEVLVPLFGCISNMDPFYYMLLDLFPNTSINHPMAIIFRVLFTFICCMETCSCFSLGIIYGILFINVLNNFLAFCLCILKSKAGSLKIFETLCVIRRPQIILNHLLSATDLILGIALATGFLVTVLCNFMTVKLFVLVPMPVYLAIPIFAILTPPVFVFFISDASQTYDTSLNIICHSKRDLWLFSQYTNKRLIRTLKSVQPFSLYAGINGFRFFKVKVSTKSTFYYAIFDYTITSLLSIPVDKFL